MCSDTLSVNKTLEAVVLIRSSCQKNMTACATYSIQLCNRILTLLLTVRFLTPPPMPSRASCRLWLRRGPRSSTSGLSKPFGAWTSHETAERILFFDGKANNFPQEILVSLTPKNKERGLEGHTYPSHAATSVGREDRPWQACSASGTAILRRRRRYFWHAEKDCSALCESSTFFVALTFLVVVFSRSTPSLN